MLHDVPPFAEGIVAEEAFFVAVVVHVLELFVHVLELFFLSFEPTIAAAAAVFHCHVCV